MIIFKKNNFYLLPEIGPICATAAAKAVSSPFGMSTYEATILPTELRGLYLHDPAFFLHQIC